MKVFGKSKALIAEIDTYLQVIQKSSMLFYEAIREYLNKKTDQFEDRVKELGKVEEEADRLRRDIKHKLYSYLLIPESRGDVLALIETLDDVVDMAEKIIKNFSIECPIIPETFNSEFLLMAEHSVKSVEALVLACNAYFTNITAVNEHINKVFFYEHEVDVVEERIKRLAFKTDEIEKFSRKVHVRYFAEKMALLSDAAEAVCDRLSVFAIKREI
jgi:uncharacterized protein